ncbi:DUF4012 domain-containing protein [Microbacterium memoriense]|uniref:DUF4012 domain-containing protein n=1 Tax=Microbacterium memoriense TaxID=2978350 RepID=A0ABT2PDW3_9MICO|nr:DUF4012 domain-containing protein [Microbacterium memoriense]MCT9001994.1 DUF4012 domain-containing protein [Microbacterium memoriense]
MQIESRRAARAARAGGESARRRRNHGRAWLIVALIAIVLLGAVSWLAFRALTVKTDLEAAQALVSNLDDGLPLDERLAEVGALAQSASTASNDPLWRAAEFVPLAGENLRAVRLASEMLDMLANNVATPILALKSEPAGGSLIASMLPILEERTPAIAQLSDEIEAVRASTALVGPVRSGLDQIGEITSSAVPLLEVAPDLLGADGPKSYLLVFQNNAESLPLGGSAASQTLISVDAGNLAIVQQASSASFQEGIPVDVAVDQSALDLYSRYLIDHVNTATSRPDFPTAAQIIRAFWNRDINPSHVDGVISIDPIALGRILLSTGPIVVGDVEVNSGNAVPVLLSDVYRWWNPYASPAEALKSDAFFAGVAETVFAKLSSGEFDLKDMAWAVNESIAQGDIMVWTDDPEVGQFLAGQRVAGTLPTDNSLSTAVGVFFRDTSASKIDYYMNSGVTLAMSCDAGLATFSASVQLHLDISQEDANRLPPYVKSAPWGSSKFRTEVFIYGPPGTTFVEASVDGRDLQPTRTDITDLGRPVAAFEVFLKPSESGTVTASFAGAGEFGPLELRSTPMIRTTQATIEGGCTG